jgi:ferredoxin
MKIRIDTEACTGHGRCYALAPEVFDADDDGYGQVAHEEIGPDQEAAARKAVLSCPERAVSIDGRPA